MAETTTYFPSKPAPTTGDSAPIICGYHYNFDNDKAVTTSSSKYDARGLTNLKDFLHSLFNYVNGFNPEEGADQFIPEDQAIIFFFESFRNLTVEEGDGDKPPKLRQWVVTANGEEIVKASVPKTDEILGLISDNVNGKHKINLDKFLSEELVSKKDKIFELVDINKRNVLILLDAMDSSPPESRKINVSESVGGASKKASMKGGAKRKVSKKTSKKASKKASKKTSKKTSKKASMKGGAKRKASKKTSKKTSKKASLKKASSKKTSMKGGAKRRGSKKASLKKASKKASSKKASMKGGAKRRGSKKTSKRSSKKASSKKASMKGGAKRRGSKKSSKKASMKGDVRKRTGSKKASKSKTRK